MLISLSKSVTRQLTLLLLLAPTVSMADYDDGVFDLTLAELLEVTVLVTSRQEEALDTAPGIVSVITKAQIQGYGANNLHDILRRVPGLLPLGMFVIRDNLISVRGQHSNSIDRRQLVLINGRPFRDASTGGFNAALYRGFPVSSIERIEIIRGPGSVLHGTNAVSGVINIVTQVEQASSASVSAGAFGMRAFEANYGRKGEQGFFNIAAKVSSTDGWDFEAFDTNGTFQSLDYGTSDHGIFINAGIGNFDFELLDVRADDDTMSIGFGQARWPDTTYDKNRRLIDLHYFHDLNERSKIDFNLTLNQQDREIANGSVDVSDDYWLAEAAYTLSFATSSNLVVGLNYHWLDSEDKSNPTQVIDFDSDWKTLYTQVSHSVTDRLRATIGAMYNDIGVDEDISTRIGITYKVSEGAGFKLFWAEAFRSPFNVEFSFNSPALQGNPNLIPEKSTGVDAQFYYTNEKLRLEFAWYRAKIDDAIVLGGGTFLNSGEFKFHGYELELKYEPLPTLNIEASYSQQNNENQQDVRDTQLVPNEVIRLGLVYQPKTWLSLSLFDNWYGEPADRTKLSAATVVRNKPAESYHHLTLNTKLDLAGALGDKYKGLSLNLHIDNALESDPVFQPDLREFRLNTLPLRSERGAYLNLEYQFQ